MPDPTTRRPWEVRSWLYVPADSERKLSRACSSGADALLLDLEDAVLPAHKQAARENARTLLAGEHGLTCWVRVNSTDEITADLEHVVVPGLSGICLPKAADAAQLSRLDQALTALELAAGLAAGQVSVMALVETAAGVLALDELVRGPRVRVVQLGEQDLVASLGLPSAALEGPAPYPLSLARGQTVLSSSAAGLTPPVAPVEVSPHARDLVSTTRWFRTCGYGSRALIHPAQVAPVHEGLCPSDEEVCEARAVLDAAHEAERRGEGVLRDSRGRMIDAPVVLRAQATLRAACVSHDR